MVLFTLEQALIDAPISKADKPLTKSDSCFMNTKLSKKTDTFLDAIAFLAKNPEGKVSEENLYIKISIDIILRPIDQLPDQVLSCKKFLA